MNKLAFLNKVVIRNDRQVASKAAVTKRPAEGADLRVYHTGAIFPSEELVKLFDLEYNAAHGGNGLDVFEGSMYHGFTSAEPVIMVAAVSRKAGRGADIFKSCEYDATTKAPKTSVLDQGATTFGKASLIPMLEKVYGETLDRDAKPYLDMKVVGCGENYNEPFLNENGSDVFYIPKQVSSGPAKGNWTNVRREKLLLWALVPLEYTADAEVPIVLSGPVFYEQAEQTDPEEDDISDAALDEAFSPEKLAEVEVLGEPEPETGDEAEMTDEPREEVPSANGVEQAPEPVIEPEPAPLPLPKFKSAATPKASQKAPAVKKN